MSGLAPDEQALADFCAVLDEERADRVARQAAYRAWVERKLPAIAEELTAALPADLRAAGLRFEWMEQR